MHDLKKDLSGKAPSAKIVPDLMSPKGASAPGTSVFISKDLPSIFVTAEDLPHFEGSLPHGMAVFGIIEVATQHVQLLDERREIIKLVVAPMLCLGFIAAQESSIEKLLRAKSTFERWSSSDFPVPVLIPHDHLNDALSTLLSTSLVERMRTYAAHTTRLSRELFLLRAAHEDMLNAFSELEHFVVASNTQPISMTFENVPSRDVTVEESLSAGIKQILPVSTLGLGHIQLHLRDWEKFDRPFGGLTVELRTIEDHVLHQVWQLPLETLHPGWITLSLEKGFAGPQRTPLVVICVMGNIGLMPPLSLGPLQVLPDFRLKGRLGQEAEQRSLALRTWTGLPGVRPPTIDLRPFDLSSSPNPRVMDIPVPSVFFRDVKAIMNHWIPEYTTVSFLADMRGLECHPPPDGETWAVLTDFPASEDAFRLSIRGMVRHPDAAKIEFAIAFATNDQAIRLQASRGDSTLSFDKDSFSGWHTASYEEPVLLSLLVGFSGASKGSIFFGTRMKDGQPNAFAWTCFYDLRKVILQSPGGSNEASLEPAAPIVNPEVPSGILDALHTLDGTTIPISILEDAYDIFSSAAKENSPVRYDSDKRGILCHPPAEGMTLAQLGKPGAFTTSRVLVRAHVANNMSEPVEFAVVLTSLGVTECVRLLEEGISREDSSFASSGWKTAAYDQDVELEAELQSAGSETGTVFLATRMSPGASGNDYAWAYFIDPKSVG